ncbi:hypothetical protein TNCV_4245961 [Trichonephila clavipes]|nr:hypothetical protein TNCV_4245961 [Trichonephila clavipes]
MIIVISDSQIEVHELHRDKGLVLRLYLVAALSTIQMTVSPPVLMENVLGGGRSGKDAEEGSPISFTLPPISLEDLQHYEYLENIHAAQALYIYKHAFSGTRPNGTGLSVTKLYTGWAAQ